MSLPRLFAWKILACALLVGIALIAPQQLPVALYKLALIVLAGVLGYWLDRSLFPYARPDSYLATDSWKLCLATSGKACSDADLVVVPGYEQIFAAAMIRRALIVLACILGVALGL